MRWGALAGFCASVMAMPALAQASFCTRLAEQTGMTAAPVKPGQRPLWSTRVMNLAQRFLVGGQAMVTMQMSSGPNPQPNDYARLSEACRNVGKTLVCTIEGPADFKLGVNGKETRIGAAPGDRAEVAMAGTRLTCSDASPPASSPTKSNG